MDSSKEKQAAQAKAQTTAQTQEQILQEQLKQEKLKTQELERQQQQSGAPTPSTP